MRDRDETAAGSAVEIFGAALELPPESRAHYLARACGGNLPLQAEVESLLRAHAGGGADFLEQPVRIPPSSEMFANLIGGAVVGTRLGSYRLVDRLAVGGMGAVYLAERIDEAYEKQVAIKLIHPGLWGSDAVARFRRERQVLADLEHPGIARLIDGGSIESDQPYLVMEYVDGLPIHRWCEEQKLDVVAILNLFIEACEAVLYAHQNLVIHRDLKPGNILVDRSGRVKLLDFGIAKVLGEPGTADRDDLTRTSMPLTPRYASPEQVAGNRMTTATDIYSLGVILYELITGSSPYDLQGKSPTQIANIITHVDPVPPSRAAKPEARRIPGDLDMIVLKALQKDPARRYLTVEELAADIRRHLAGLPVLARPDTPAYRLSKFVTRNKGLVAAFAAVFLIIVAALVVNIRESRHARSAQREAEWKAYEASLAAAESALRAAQVGEAEQHLEAAPARLRSWEWNHLHTRLDRSRTTFQAHDQGITRIVPLDGNRFLTSSIDSTLKMWSGAGGDLLQTYGPFSAEVESVAPLKGSAVAAIGLNNGRVHLVDLGDRSVRELLPAGPAWAFVSANSDGTRLACGFFDGRVRVWEMPSGKLIANWKAQPGLALPAYSPDGTLLAVAGGNGELIFYDARSHARLKDWAAHERRIYNMAFSPDGKWLVTGSMDQTANVWDVQRRALVRTFREHRATVGAIAFDPDGKDVLTAAGDNRLLRWDLSSGEVQGEFRGHRVDVSALASSSDGMHLVSGDWSGGVKSWDWTTDDVRTFRVTTDWLVPTIYDAAWDPQEARLTCGSTDVLTHIWNRNGTECGELRSDQPCRAVEYSQDGSLLFAGNDLGKLLVFGNEPSQSRSLPIHQGPILALSLDPTGNILATASADSSLKLFSVPELELLREIRGHEGAVQDVEFSPHDNDVLASCSADGTIRLWSASTGQSIAVARAGDSSVNDVAFKASGKTLVSVSTSGQVRIWNDQLQPLASLPSSSSKVNAVAWSQSGSRIATGGSDAVVRLYDAESGREITRLHGHVSAITSLHFGHGDAFLTSTSVDGTVKMWDVGVDVALQ